MEKRHRELGIRCCSGFLPTRTSRSRQFISGGADALVSSYSKAHLRRLLKLSWLAPDIVAAIAQGKQPPTLTGRRLLRAADVPLGWEEQRRFFGFH